MIFRKRSQGTASALLSGTWSTGSTSAYPPPRICSTLWTLTVRWCGKTGVVTPWTVMIFQKVKEASFIAQIWNWTFPFILTRKFQPL